MKIKMLPKEVYQLELTKQEMLIVTDALENLWGRGQRTTRSKSMVHKIMEKLGPTFRRDINIYWYHAVKEVRTRDKHGFYLIPWIAHAHFKDIQTEMNGGNVLIDY